MSKRNIQKQRSLINCGDLPTRSNRIKLSRFRLPERRIYVPPYAQIEFEYERDSKGNEEIEIELKWNKS